MRENMHHSMTPEEADREKRAAALSSVAAAILLTLLKLGVGLATRSLGMLSEALHSGLDLLASALTYFAVRFASLPPDSDHPYGHGKMENLSALVEALLLLITCAWIIWEAVDRLFFNPVHVTPSLLAVAVMVISIIVDFTRSRMLKRMAEKHRSQALEADALHFSTDILSSLVVLIGLGALCVATLLPEDSTWRPWLERADSLAAMGVAAIVIQVSYALGKRAVNVLLDAGDRTLTAEMRDALARLPGIRKIKGLRLRQSGSDLFVDVVLGVDSALILEETRQLRQDVEAAVRAVADHASVSVELVPEEEGSPDRIATVRGLAAAQGLLPHSVELQEVMSPSGDEWRRLLVLHVELPPQCTLGNAHAQVSVFEDQVRQHIPDLIIVTHLEPKAEEGASGPMMHEEAEHIHAVARELVAREHWVTDCHNVLVRSCGNGLYVSFHCRMHPETTVAIAHDAASRLQAALHTRMPELTRVIVHIEPFKEEQPAPNREKCCIE